MKYTTFIIGFICILISCKKESSSVDSNLPKDSIENNQQKVFNALWTDFNKNYPAFQINNINWDSVYKTNYPKLTSNTSDRELFSILNSSILTLKDAHSDIISNQFGATDYYNIFVRQKPTNFISWMLIGTKYIDVLLNNNHSIAFGKIKGQDIGYLFVASFADGENDYSLLDSFITKFQNSKGIIIDVRQNSGGNANNGKIIASRLTNKSVICQYERYNTGSGNSGLTDFTPILLEPNNKTKYLNKVILITNRHTFSAAENFTLWLRSLPNVTHIGDTTFGGVASNVISKSLPNGWTYRMPKSIEYDNNKISIKNGIAPQVPILISKSDSINGNDKILEKAIELINEK
jgi:hypothetical protein